MAGSVSLHWRGNVTHFHTFNPQLNLRDHDTCRPSHLHFSFPAAPSQRPVPPPAAPPLPPLSQPRLGLVLPCAACHGYDPHVYFKIPKGSLHTEGPRKNGLATFPRSVFTQFHRISSNLEGEVGVWKLMPHCQYLLGIRLRLRYLVKRTPFTPRLLSHPPSHLISAAPQLVYKLN